MGLGAEQSTKDGLTNRSQPLAPLAQPRIWKPEGGELVAESLLVEIDELGEMDDPEEPGYESRKAAERVVTHLLVTNRLGVRVTGDLDLPPDEIDEDAIQQLAELGRAAISHAGLELENVRKQYFADLEAATLKADFEATILKGKGTRPMAKGIGLHPKGS